MVRVWLGVSFLSVAWQQLCQSCGLARFPEKCISQIMKCICQNSRMYLSTFSNVFVWICKCICRLATALSVARPCAIPSKVRNFTLQLNRRRKKLGWQMILKAQIAATGTYWLSPTSLTNLICNYEIHFAIHTNTFCKSDILVWSNSLSFSDSTQYAFGEGVY